MKLMSDHINWNKFNSKLLKTAKEGVDKNGVCDFVNNCKKCPLCSLNRLNAYSCRDYREANIDTQSAIHFESPMRKLNFERFLNMCRTRNLK